MFLFIAADKSVHIYALSATLAFEFVCAFVGHTKGISDVNWSADSRYVCSASDDCTVMVWSVRSVCFVKLANLFYCFGVCFMGDAQVTQNTLSHVHTEKMRSIACRSHKRCF